MGAWADLPQLRPPRTSPDTLGQLLQRAQTPQLARRPITDQSRPQRPEAGHLELAAPAARGRDAGVVHVRRAFANGRLKQTKTRLSNRRLPLEGKALAAP